jgi:hypothetical protein
MVEPVRHRQTKGAVTDMFDLQPPRHTSTLPNLPIEDESGKDHLKAHPSRFCSLWRSSAN